jgi:hypothetical protein
MPRRKHKYAHPARRCRRRGMTVSLLGCRACATCCAAGRTREPGHFWLCQFAIVDDRDEGYRRQPQAMESRTYQYEPTLGGLMVNCHHRGTFTKQHRRTNFGKWRDLTHGAAWRR